MREHGQFLSTTCGQVITFAARGPWNDEAMKNGCRELAEVMKQVDMTNPWAQISCLAGEAIMPPSTFDIFLSQSKIRQKLGLQALAIVICDSDIKSTIKSQLQNCYTEAGTTHEFFDDLSSALAWLDTFNVSIDHDAIISHLHSVPFLPKDL
ncbi:hypothetical protein [Aestuariibacter salexigens]|uniref:hypothetical protein n=1 Tax=Aestuariibacter salexigens TaxID=226010 RepID=UPI000684CE8D|nr:hypothetical protein [Aestuariibacter salexigens]